MIERNSLANISIAFWLLFMGVLSFIFFLCALRTNIVFVMIFFSLTFCFLLITAAFWALAEDFTGNAVLAQKLLKVSPPSLPTV